MSNSSPNRRAFISVGLFASALLLAEGGAIRAASPTTPASATAKLAFPSLLQTYGNKYSLYFTVEQDDIDLNAGIKDASGNPKFSPLASHSIQLPATMDDASAFLAALANSLPDADIFKDDSVPGVMHIREKSLVNKPGYLLDKKSDLLFRGTTGEFIAHVASQSDWTFKESWNFASPGPGRYNPSRATEVYLKAATFRTILSAGLPRLSNHVLWTSRAIQEEGRLVAIVIFNPSSPTNGDPKVEPLPTEAVREIDAAMQQIRQSQHDSDRAAATLVSNPNAAVFTITDPDKVATSEDIITARIPLRNIPAQNLLNDLRPLLAPDAATGAVPDPNSLIIRDTSAHNHRYLEIINCLEEAAGKRRAIAIAHGADSRGVAWAGKPAAAIQWPPAEKKPGSFYRTPVYYGADSTRIDATNKDQPITQIIPLNNITSATAAQNLATMSDEGTNPPLYWQCPTANCLIITDTPARILRGMQIIEKLEAAHAVPTTSQSTQPR